MKLVIAVSAVAMLAAATPVVASPAMVRIEAVRNAQDPALAAVLADYEAYLRAVDPINAGMEGDRDALSRLPDGSRAFELAQEPVLKGFADRLAGINAAFDARYSGAEAVERLEAENASLRKALTEAAGDAADRAALRERVAFLEDQHRQAMHAVGDARLLHDLLDTLGCGLPRSTPLALRVAWQLGAAGEAR